MLLLKYVHYCLTIISTNILHHMCNILTYRAALTRDHTLFVFDNCGIFGTMDTWKCCCLPMVPVSWNDSCWQLYDLIENICKREKLQQKVETSHNLFYKQSCNHFVLASLFTLESVGIDNATAGLVHLQCLHLVNRLRFTECSSALVLTGLQAQV